MSEQKMRDALKYVLDCEKRGDFSDMQPVREALAQQPVAWVELTQVLDCYDAGLLNDFGGGNVEWWQDYMRAELARAHDFYQSQMVAQKTADDDQTAYIDGFRSARFESLAAFRSLRQILGRKPLDIPGALMVIDSVLAASEAKKRGV